MRLTRQQHDAVLLQGNTYVQACPGSGKTRVLVSKALHEVKDVVGTPRKIACITFTNAAVEEMERRLRVLGTDDEVSSIEIGTIHSFCLRNIFKPFRCRSKYYSSGYEIVSGDDDRAVDLLKKVAARRGVGLKPFEIEMAGQIAIDSKGNPVAGGAEQWLLDCVSEYWDEFRKRAWIDFSLLIFESLRFLQDYPEIKVGLSAKFKTALVDEFQDTTEVQLEVLRQMHTALATTFFLVGDPHQSIYRFAGASPIYSDAFITSIGIDQAHPISGNFRSARKIVASAEKLLPRIPPMEAIGQWADFDADLSVYETDDVGRSVAERFVPTIYDLKLPLGSCAVLAARWTDLLDIARVCVRYGVPVVGPGARPYRRGRLIVPILEQLAAIAGGNGSVIATQRAMIRCINELPGYDSRLVEGWNGRVITLEMHLAAMESAAADSNPLNWIIDVASKMDRILHVKNVGYSDAFAVSANEVVSDIYTNANLGRVDLNTMTLERLGFFADPTNALKLMTVHASKGREFEAVAMVHMNEGRFPHFKSTTTQQIEESRRVVYVGLTRAQRVAHLIVDTSDRRNGPSRFLAEMA